MRGKRARLHRVPLAEIPVVVDDAEPLLCASLEQALGRAVDRTVRDDDHLDLLVMQALAHDCGNRLDVADDLVSSVVDGDDDRQQRPGRRRARSGVGELCAG